MGAVLPVRRHHTRRDPDLEHGLGRSALNRDPHERAHLVVVMGPAGVGKSAAGRLVAKRLGLEFLDADDFHSPANIEAMRHGIPLDDAHRRPWLERLNQALRARRTRGAVLACSALRDSYRDTLRQGLPNLQFVALMTTRATLEQRLRDRSHHYAGPELMDSQLATLELTDDVIVVDAGRAIDEVVNRVVEVVSPAP